MTAPALDELIGGRYRLRARIAAGGMGEVWRGEDTLLDRTVAVKTLRSEHVDDEEFRARFRVEARCAARLSCPGVATVLDFGEEPGRAWLVLELVDGESLSGLLRREGWLSPQRTLDLVAQAADALGAAHAAGVVHRDVKPGNLLVRPDGVVKITDFGIASAVDAAPITRTGTMLGTASYLSPEQAAGKPATGASDLYALGVVAYECLSGARPFRGDTAVVVALAHLRDDPPALPADVPAPVAALVLELLAKDPADRPDSGTEVAVRARALRDQLLSPGALAEPADGGARVLPAPRVTPPPQAHDGGAEPTQDVAGALPYPPSTDPPRTGVLPSPVGDVLAREPQTPERRRPPLLPVALGVALLVLLALVAVAVRAVDDGDAPPADSEVVADTVPVDAAALVGRPVGEVTAELEAAGLQVATVPGPAGTGAAAGTVADVTPAGSVPPGSTITLTVVPEPPAPAAVVAPPAPAPAPAAPAPAAEPAPVKPPKSKDVGEGSGKGQGAGKGGSGKGKP